MTIYTLYFMALAFFIPACAGLKQRESDRLIVLQQRYSGSIVRVIITEEDGAASSATSFYTGQQHGFLTARHVFVSNDQTDNVVSISELMLHIPSAVTGFSVEMGKPPSDDRDILGHYTSDWAAFKPTNDILVRRPLVYDPERYLRPGQDVYIAGYPGMDRDYVYSGVFPVEYIATRNLFIHKVKYIKLTILPEGTGSFGIDTVKIPKNLPIAYGMSGGPVMIWDNAADDFVAVGLMIRDYSEVYQDIPMLVFIRPRISNFGHHDDTN